MPGSGKLGLPLPGAGVWVLALYRCGDGGAPTRSPETKGDLEPKCKPGLAGARVRPSDRSPPPGGGRRTRAPSVAGPPLRPPPPPAPAKA